MNRSIEIIKEIYKPYRYTIKGTVKILETTSGNIVIKNKTDKESDLFSYLSSRGFNNYPMLIDHSRKDINVYEYIEDTYYPKEQRAADLIKLIANLHYKTSFYKDVTEDKFKEIYDAINSNILYLSDKFEKYFDVFFKKVYHSPSKYLFMRNYSILKADLNFCQKELDSWYDLIKEKKKIKVCVCHNNLSLDHYLKNKKDYLISWSKSTIDTPVLDLAKFYRKEYFNLNFEDLLESYFKIFSYSEDEKKLFFILISLPEDIKFLPNEFESVLNLRKNLDYIYKTEILVRPYYTKDKKKENSD